MAGYVDRGSSLELAAQFFDLLADPTRLKILALLDQRGQMSAAELYDALGISQPATSRHEALLRRGLLIEPHRVGKYVYYRLAALAPRDLLRLACQGVEDVEKK